MNTKLIVSIFVVIGGLLISTSAQAQVAISEEGVTFPDDTEQTSAAILPMNCPHGDSIVWDTSAQSWVCETDLSPLYAIGDTGPAGGIVFYLEPGSNGRHGLEAAPPGLNPYLLWCREEDIHDLAYLDNVPAFNVPDSNSGDHNTVYILPHCRGAVAALAGAAYVWPNGKLGGFLPNKEELYLMYQNRDAIGGFKSSSYWSSSENGFERAWSQDFVTGIQNNTRKDFRSYARPVRAF